MAFNAAFAIIKTNLPSIIRLEDISTGSDAGLTSRIVELVRADGSAYTDAITWPIADDAINIDVLPKDVALQVKVSFISSAPLGGSSTYFASQIYAFIFHGQLFAYNLSMLLLSNPPVIQSQGYFDKKQELYVGLDDAINAINTAQSIVQAQAAIDRYQYLTYNSQYFF